MLKLKLQYFDHLMWRTDSLERTDSQPWCWETLKAGGDRDDRGSMVGWHHWLNEHNFKQALWAVDGLGMLVCCIPWDHKEWTQLSDCTEQNCDIEWFAFEMNRDHSSIFETAPKYCILDSSVDYESDSISSKGFLPTIVNSMVIWINSPISIHFNSLIPKMLIFTLAISYLTTSNLPLFMDLTFQVPMQYCYLQHQTLLSPPDTSSAGCCFHSGSASSFLWNYFPALLQ